MAEHEPGSMEISEQQKTFSGFLRVCAWVVGVVFIILIFLALVNA